MENLHEARLEIKHNFDSIYLAIELFIDENKLIQKNIITIIRLPLDYFD
jgi:hypothetical protein